MDAEARELIREIEEAFDGMPRPQDVTMRVARALDDYISDEKELAELRKLDSEKRWQDIPAKDIETYYDIFAFLEPEGCLYYIAPFMTVALKYDHLELPVGDYTICACNLFVDKFTLLTARQKEVIAKFLKFCMAERGRDFHFEYAKKAYKKYWHQFDIDGQT